MIQPLKSWVRCDEPGCNWQIECTREEISSWHKKPCPKCGKGEIVSDMDLVIFRLAISLEAVSKEIAEPGAKTVRVKLDTALLRDLEKETDR